MTFVAKPRPNSSGIAYNTNLINFEDDQDDQEPPILLSS